MIQHNQQFLSVVKYLAQSMCIACILGGCPQGLWKGRVTDIGTRSTKLLQWKRLKSSLPVPSCPSLCSRLSTLL